MKGLIVFIASIAVILGIGSFVWWFVDGTLPEEQLIIVQDKINGSVDLSSNVASNTAESASKLGKVLKNSFDEAQDVYENGAEAKYE